jgi:uncharacterized protein
MPSPDCAAKNTSYSSWSQTTTLAVSRFVVVLCDVIIPLPGNMLRIDYIEFSVTDVSRAKAFYQEAFGWTFQDWGEGYASFEDGRLTGGLSKVETVSVGGPLVILYAEELELALEAVVNAKGAITKPIFAFPGGRRFEFSDPDGNGLAVWSDTGVAGAGPD